MKQLLFAAALFVSSLFVNATEPTVSTKILKSFHKSFSLAEDVTWSVVDKMSIANFELDDTHTTASFNEKGKIVLVMRYYKSNQLPKNIKDALINNLGKKKIHGVTEITNSNGTVYKVILKDAKKYYDVLADAEGNVEVKHIYTRADI